MAVKTMSVQPSKAPGGGPDIYDFTGLSTDTKPTPPTNQIGDGSTFEELDTNNIYTFSTLNTNPATSDGWWI